ncbi:MULTISPECIES: ATP-binding protein [Actinosynnema]|uniref:ATP-binding protein n=1 Tax=Actinosynnema TaxID=40566 RepID=UPI0020A5DDF9|nr:ATP-binding protein [Actinosynnema pretiosum]MCP2095803.1 Histidine kinase-like ATPase domain [Actinosynnema pretiosum]
MTFTYDVDHVDGATVVRPEGRLDLSTYVPLRDGLLKCAVTGPSAVVVLLGDGFEFATPALMSVFSTVWTRVAEWPGVRIVLVGESDPHRAALAGGGAGRFVPHYPTLTDALASVEHPAQPQRDEALLPDTPVGALIARQFVRETCERWDLGDRIEDAVLVATELVENALEHTSSAPSLRLELRGGRLVVAVRDGGATPPKPPPPAGRGLLPGGRGMRMVESVSRVWGHSPWPGGGKVVWAVLGR